MADEVIDAAEEVLKNIPSLIEVGRKDARGERLNYWDKIALLKDRFDRKVMPELRAKKTMAAVSITFAILSGELAEARERRIELEDRVAALETAKPAKKRPR